MQNKKKMPIEKKVKLIYSGELLLISVVFLVIGILKLTNVLGTNPTRLFIYNIITTVGFVYIVGDFIWTMISKKKRQKSCLIDKFLVLPVGLYLIVFDIICFVEGENINTDFVKYSVGIVLLYLAVVYIFQGIYHYHKLTPQLLEAIEEAKLEEEQKKNPPKEDSNQDKH